MAEWKINGKIKLMIIVGTRPEIIRLAAVIKKCRKYFDTLLVHTGQNYDYNLNGVFFFHDYSNHIVNDDVLARLISMPNVIVTSHQAFLTREALSNIADTTLSNICEIFSSDRCVKVRHDS